MKKKGLIISTIVMVVVLIACLSTATYAWFTATAKVTVREMTVQTVASEGLQIAIKDGANYYNGAIGHDGTKFNGDPGWGSNISLADAAILGQLDNAVTKALTANAYKIKKDHMSFTVANFSDATFYTVPGDVAAAPANAVITPPDGTGTALTAINTDSIIDGKPVNPSVDNWSTIVGEIVEDYVYVAYAEDTYIVPTHYTEDGTATPLGFTKAMINKNYIYLPIVVRATAHIESITCKITITPVMGTVSADFSPGMAAAARLGLDYGRGTITNGTFEPYPDDRYSLSDTGMNGPANVMDSDNIKEFVIAGNADADANNVQQNDEYQAYLTIWVEGTDDECTIATTGTGFTVEVDFTYTVFGG